ncbi:YczE/YyaS/YitT family protein [Litchfieldia alkalitelluris]|uniref:YczE/YyaS/YitT family protein n=1 Tax=Litchfieldia alkalitelluris TaxID=304268 RepID=UPI000997646A|nr:YitT family protein [Litchfieldia alkalitelluris]
MKGHHQVSQQLLRWGIYFSGLLVMSLGIVLTIKADLGASPWDVFHIGLYKQLGLTIGTWSIIVGFVILGISSIVSKKLPQAGALVNMLTVGIFIDMYMALPFLNTPDFVIGKILMLIIGIVINGYGMGLYISARLGAGPRDSLMIALTEKIKWKIQHIRSSMEIIVLIIGWILGGPVFIGTILYCLVIGNVVGFALPQCTKLADQMMFKIGKTKQRSVSEKQLSH